jgi:hypothetical protein
MRNLSRIALIAGVMVLGVGCTRDVDPEKNKVTFSLPDHFQLNGQSVGGIGTQTVSAAVFKPMHIRANVHESASGGSILAIWAWDACGGHCDDPTKYAPPPPTISMDVASGSGRLVQLMVAGQLGSSDGLAFTYADQVVNLEGKEVSIVMVPTQVGSGTEGSISGRYLVNSTDGPTGTVQIFMQPLAGRPRMLIHSDMMFAGFFHLFFVEGANMSYYMPEINLPLFDGQNVSLSYLDTLSSSTSAMKVQSATYYTLRTPNSSGELNTHASSISYLGWFGPGVTGQKMCYSSSPSVISGAGTGYSGTELSATLTGTLNWAISGTNTTDIHRVSGGDIYSNCSSQTENVSKITLAHAQFKNGVEDVLGFRGPFKQPSSSDIIVKTISGTSANLDWEYISQTGMNSGPGHIDGMTVFYTTDGAGFDIDVYHVPGRDGISCNAVNLNSGWSKIFAAYPTTSATIPNVVNPSALRFVVCPTYTINGQNFYYDYGMTPYSGVGNGGNNIKMKINIANDAIAPNICTPISFDIVNYSTDILTAPTSAKTVSVNLNGVGELHTQSDCLDSSVSLPLSLAYAATDTSKQYYIWSPSVTGIANVYAVPTDFMSDTKDIGFVGPAANLANFQIQGYFTSGIALTKCYQIRVVASDASYNPVYGGGGTGGNGTTGTLVEYTDTADPVTGAAMFYDSVNCSGTGVANNIAITIPPTSFYKDISFKVSALSVTANSRAIHVSDTDIPSTYGSTFSSPFAVGSNSIAAYKYYGMGGPLTSGQCQQIYFMGENEVGASIDRTTNGTLNLSIPSADYSTSNKFFASESECTGGSGYTQTTSATLYAGYGGTSPIWVNAATGNRVIEYSDGTVKSTGAAFSGTAAPATNSFSP